MAPKKNIKNIPLGMEDSFKRIGLTLRGARRQQSQSIKEVSEQLRISVDYLSKLESGAFQDLPAPAYVNGFLRSYAQHLGLVPDALVARYAALSIAKDTKPQHKMPMTTRPPQHSAAAIASMLVVFAAVAYGGWFFVKGNTEDSTSLVIAKMEIEKSFKGNESLILEASIGDNKNAPSGDLEGEIKNSENMIDVNAKARNVDEKSPLKHAVTPVVEGILHAENKLEIDDSQVLRRASAKADTSIILDEGLDDSLGAANLKSSDQFAEMQILATPYLGSAELQNSSTAVANLRDPSQEITIRAVASSWVEIVRDNGEEVLAKLMQAGDVYVVESNTHLYLSTGNAGGLTIAIGAGDPIIIGDVGEIVRDLPLAMDKLRKGS